MSFLLDRSSSLSVTGMGHTVRRPQGPFEKLRAYSGGKVSVPWMVPMYIDKLPLEHVALLFTGPVAGIMLMPVEIAEIADTVPVAYATAGYPTAPDALTAPYWGRETL